MENKPTIKQEATKQLPVLLKFGENIELNLYDILSVNGFGNYSKIELANGKSIVSCKCLAAIDRMNLAGLIRINRHSILPICQIRNVIYHNKEVVTLSTLALVKYKVSKRRIDRVLEALNTKRGDARRSESRSVYCCEVNEIVA